MMLSDCPLADLLPKEQPWAMLGSKGKAREQPRLQVLNHEFTLLYHLCKDGKIRATQSKA